MQNPSIATIVRSANNLRRALGFKARPFPASALGSNHGGAAGSIADSDKHYWHRYTETYQRAFARLADVRRVIEFGVHHGDSIRWLAECFPRAEIIGADILPVRPEWPSHPRISYRQTDQADRTAIKAMLDDVMGEVDLIIDDGSHAPRHQASCLAEGVARLRSNGLYILEDIGTSHPLHPGFAQYGRQGARRVANALNVLMAIQHLKDIGGVCAPDTLGALSAPEFLSRADIEQLFAMTGRIEIFKRTLLPFRCFACGGSDFDYVSWLCRCGVELNHQTDSMTALVWKR